MANGGSITWVLDIDDKNFSRGIDRASDKAESASRSIGSKFSGSLKRAASASLAFASALTGVAVVGGGLVGWAVKSAANTEMLRTSLNTLTGSAKEGGKVFKDLYKFASTTPFETGDLASATQTMLSFGISSKDVMKDLRMLGDISMGNKEKLSGLSLAFSQVQSTGRLMGQDLLQMINAGFNPLTIIAEKTGKSMVQLKDEMAAGAISVDMVRDAMVTATSEGGLFFKGMEKGAETLEGRWSTLKDTVGTLARELVGLSETGEVIKGGLVDKVKTALEEFTTFLEENGPKIKQHIMDSLGWIKDNGAIVAGIIGGPLLLAFGKLAIAVWASLWPVLAVAAIGALLGAAIQLIVDKMGGWEAVMKKLKPTLDDISFVLEAVWKFLLKDIVEGVLKDFIEELKNFWDINKGWIIPVLKLLAAVLVTLVVVAIVAVGGAILAIIKVITEVIRAWNWLKETIVTVVKIIYNAVVGNDGEVTKLSNKLIELFNALPGLIKAALSGLKTIILGPFAGAFDSILSLAREMADKIRSSIAGAFNVKKKNSPSILDRLNILKDSVQGTLNSIQIPTYSSQIGTNIGGLTDKLAYSSATPSFTVNIGTYAGTDMEKRELARQIFEAYGDYAKGRGLTI